MASLAKLLGASSSSWQLRLNGRIQPGGGKVSLPSCSSGEPGDCSFLSALTLCSWGTWTQQLMGEGIPWQLYWGDKRGESSDQWVPYMTEAGSD